MTYLWLRVCQLMHVYITTAFYDALTCRRLGDWTEKLSDLVTVKSAEGSRLTTALPMMMDTVRSFRNNIYT